MGEKQMDKSALRHAFGAFMTGVTVVTSHNSEGEPLGFTANSFTSVSLDPPLVLVCLANSSINYQTFANADGFAVNILEETQVDISNTFARPVDDRFATVSWKNGPHGSPIIDAVSAWFDCSMHQSVNAGDHIVLIGRVEAFESSTAAGLGYARGAYVTPSAEAEVFTNNPQLIVSALVERDGKILLIKGAGGDLCLPETLVDGQGTSDSLKKLILSTGLKAQPGFVYSIFDDIARNRQHISFLCQAAEGEPSRGDFVSLDSASLAGVTNLAVSTMLRRFASEREVGNYGVYYGNETFGEVQSIGPGKRK